MKFTQYIGQLRVKSIGPKFSQPKGKGELFLVVWLTFTFSFKTGYVLPLNKMF